MGYSTRFSGELKFVHRPSKVIVGYIASILGEEATDADPDFDHRKEGWLYFDLELTKHKDGIKWNGAEKTRDMVATVNWLTQHLQKEMPLFRLHGELIAQGEEIGDVWKLVMEDGIAKKITIPIADLAECPECGHKWRTGQEES